VGIRATDLAILTSFLLLTGAGNRFVGERTDAHARPSGGLR